MKIHQYELYKKYKKKYIELKYNKIGTVYLYNFSQPSRKIKCENSENDGRSYEATPYEYIALNAQIANQENYKKKKFVLENKLYYFNVVINKEIPDNRVEIIGKNNFDYTFNTIYGKNEEAKLFISEGTNFYWKKRVSNIQVFTNKIIIPKKIKLKNVSEEIKKTSIFNFIDINKNPEAKLKNYFNQFVKRSNKELKKEYDKKLIGHYGPCIIKNSLIFFGYYGVTDYKAIIYIISEKKYEYNKNYFSEHKKNIENKKYYIYILFGLDKTKETNWLTNIVTHTENLMKRYKTSSLKEVYKQHSKSVIQKNKNYEKIIDKKKLIKEINQNRNKWILFYTGAGISYLNIPNIKIVYEDLLNSSSIENMLDNPQKQIEIINKWFQEIRDANATQGHIALTNILRKLSNESNIVTSNFDKLQEKAGYLPLHFVIDKKVIKELIESNSKNLYMILALGLSADRGGIIKFAREKNEKVKIIVVGEKEIPNFVLKQQYNYIDYDIQKLLPYINNNLI